MGKGVALARSPLVWIAESDDTSSPHFLERLLPYFADDRLALAYAESRVIGEQGQWLADSYRFYTDGITSRKWLTAYVEDGKTEIDQALAIKNTIANASAVVFRRAVLARHLQTIEPFRYCGDWWSYIQCLQEGRIAYHPEALNSHRRSANSVTHVGVGSSLPLAEALRVESALWRSPCLSDRSRVLGFVQMLFEAALRGNCDLDGPLAAAVVDAWNAAVTSNRRPIDREAFVAGLEYAERLASEEVGAESARARHGVDVLQRPSGARRDGPPGAVKRRGGHGPIGVAASCQKTSSRGFRHGSREKEKLKIFQWAIQAPMTNEDLRNNPVLTYYGQARGLSGGAGDQWPHGS